MMTIRSTLFNILFFCAAFLECILFLPLLFCGKKGVRLAVRLFTSTVYALEKYILGLDYEVRGLENLPKDQSYIIASKHQSPYETFKMHRILPDIAIIFKKELLNIPIWGAFVKAADGIPIDRSSGRKAVQSIIEGAKKIQNENRPILIFPQGTRVSIETTIAEKPYRMGAVHMYRETGMPIVPLALNSGVFWPKGSWLKKPGRVVFEFLPPLMPGLSDKDALDQLTEQLETATLKLVKAASGEEK